MNLFDEMELKKSAFTKTDLEVYEAIKHNYEFLVRESSNMFAKRCNISQAALTRFCKRIGFEGYSGFRFALYNSIQTGRGENGFVSKADNFKRIIDMLYTQADNGQFDLLVEQIIHSNTITLSGQHRSSLPAMLMDMELHMLGLWSSYLPHDQCVASASIRTTKNDLFVLFSEQSNYYQKYIDVLTDTPSRVPYLILITMERKHPLRNRFDDVIWLPSSSNQNMEIRIEPSLIFSTFVDIILGLVREKMA